ncbi:uncharacterized protein LOC112152984 isoform X2 [Oryzias melastigma]|uniref:uncharacterized protein LOC112152984 isoform X2 n=1 Tax=Oryzias melastigma TaxID=30732 RepID=UPI00168D25C5|nr:uncharacterized protein LOC112152984 isoform X2 [Oryzias melastigma]
MLILFHLLLVFGEKCCANNLFYVTKAVKVGDHVKLDCSRGSAGELVWMRIVFDHPPENLEKTENKTPHVKVKLEPGTLELKIVEAKQSDTGLYICMRNKSGNLLSFNVTYLRVEEPAVTEAPPPTPSLPVCPGNSMTLQCSILHDSLNNSCLSNESVLCFNTESNNFYPNNTKDNRVNKEEKNSEGTSVNKCFPSIFKNLPSSDGWTYYCAAPKCEEKTPEERTQTNICTWTSKDETVKNCLIAALVISQIFIVLLLYLVKKLKTESRDSSHVPQQISPSAHSDQENQQASKNN